MKDKNELNVYSEDIVKALMVLTYYDELNAICFKTRDIFVKCWNDIVSKYDVIWDMYPSEKQSPFTYSRFIKIFGSFTKMKQLLKDLNYIA